MCEGKASWSSKDAATRALRALRRPQGRMHAYRCGAHWHIGHRDRLDRSRS